MFSRKFGKVMLGKATPFHLYATCILAGLVAFAPGFTAAPALWVTLVAIICILPVNLFLMGVLGGLLFLLSLLIQPFTFSVGRFLIDGPTSGLFEVLINAPFTALMGFEYYVGSGGMLVGLVLGVLCGFLLTRLIRSLRAGMLKLDKNSPKFNAYADRSWVKLLTWILLGAKPNMELYEKLANKKVGMPIRPMGVVVALVVFGGFLGLGHLLSGPVLTKALHSTLEEANGATVDLNTVEFDLAEGKLVIDGLAMADKENLAEDVFRALRVDADISVESLLSRRVRVDKIVLSDTSSGRRRDKPGEIIGGDTPPADVPPENPEDKTLDDYIEDAEKWRERLEQIQRWMEKLGGPSDPEVVDDESLEERLKRQAELWGYGAVTAAHRIEGSPLVVINEIRAEGLQVMQLNGDLIDVVGENLSTQPRLLDAPPKLSIRKKDGTMVFEALMAGVSAGRGKNNVTFSYKGIPTDAIRIKTDPMTDGTIDVSTSGIWGVDGKLDFQLNTMIHKANWKLPGMSKPEKIELIELPIRVSGPVSDPRILFREEDLSAALKKAGKKELTKRLGKELEKHVGEDVGKAIGGLFGDKKK